MKVQRFLSSFQGVIRTAYTGCICRRYTRQIATQSTGIESKYAQKVVQKSNETGLTVGELLKKARVVKEERWKADVEELKKAAENIRKQSNLPPRDEKGVNGQMPKGGNDQICSKNERKDAPPYKELGSILNLQRLLSAPHTAQQISALWAAYHASRSGGTGRGFVCASIPLTVYEKMAKNGRKYPSFVVPVPHAQQQRTAVSVASEDNTAHEFYYLQWDFNPPPPIPSTTDDLFTKPTYTTPSGLSNPPTAMVLYTPLQEYKLRQTFATPYLVLTMYTDLAATHGIVLLRGEITPTGTGHSSSKGRYMMSQEDAQLLVIALQRFYLWTKSKESGKDGIELLMAFHEKPQEFEWKDLLRFSEPTA